MLARRYEELRSDNNKLQAMLADTQNMLATSQQRAKLVESLQQRVEVLADAKAQLLREANHTAHVRDLFASVKDKTREVQDEAQRVLREVERASRNDGSRRPSTMQEKRPPAVAARAHQKVTGW